VKVARVGQGHVTFDDVWLVAAQCQAVLSRPLFRRRSQPAEAPAMNAQIICEFAWIGSLFARQGTDQDIEFNSISIS
jgi:hypothetical protein